MNQGKKHIDFAPLASVPGLHFRHFTGEEDYNLIQNIFLAAKQENGIFWNFGDDVEEIKEVYQYYPNFDIQKQFAIVERNDSPVGTLEYFWQDGDKPQQRDFYLNFFWLPQVSDTQIPSLMLSYMETKCRELNTDSSAFLNIRLMAAAEKKLAVLESSNFKPIQYNLSMVRDLSQPIEPHPLPSGLELRPVQPEHYKAIWVANHQAFEDHWGEVDSEEDIQRWQQHPQFQPKFWKIAWDGGHIAGMVLNYIDEQENENSPRKHGQVEGVSVTPHWRRKGTAKALITESLNMYCEMGMDDARLGVVVENKHGALALYSSLRFVEVEGITGILMRKQL